MIYRIKEARKLSGMTVQDAANGLGFSKQYLSKIENKGCKMDSKKLIKFANFYKVSVDYLITNKARKEIKLTNIKWFCNSKYY